MARRGRLRHPDILTPREWEVLALLREGLNNRQIAERLGITKRTAKFHVSEIVSKLGVANRDEAARWTPEQPPRWMIAGIPALSFLKKPAFQWLPGAVAGVVLVGLVAALALMSWGMARTAGDATVGPSAASDQVAPESASQAPEPVPVALDVSAREPSRYVIAWVEGTEGPPPEATMHLRTVDAATHDVRSEQALDDMWQTELVPTNSPVMAAAPDIVVYSVAGNAQVTRLGDDGPSAFYEFEGYPPGHGFASDGEGLLRPEGDRVVVRDAAGNVTATYGVPKPLPPAPDDPIFRTTAIISDEYAGHVSALVATPDGHIFAFISGLSNSVLADLTDGRRLDLPGYSPVDAATLGEDGFLYAAAGLQSELEVLKIDPATLRIVTHQHTDPHFAGVLNARIALATPNGDVYFYLPPFSYGYESYVYKVDPHTGVPKLVPLPPRLGLDATVGIDGKIYFSGGSAGNRVSVYDPVTDTLEQDVPWLRAPEGTYVQGVVVR